MSKPVMNAHIGEYRTTSQRITVRVLTYLCPCGAVSAIRLGDDEVPNEGLCNRCYMHFVLLYEDDAEAALDREGYEGCGEYSPQEDGR